MGCHSQQGGSAGRLALDDLDVNALPGDAHAARGGVSALAGLDVLAMPAARLSPLAAALAATLFLAVAAGALFVPGVRLGLGMWAAADPMVLVSLRAAGRLRHLCREEEIVRGLVQRPASVGVVSRRRSRHHRQTLCRVLGG
jgi:hypothetical protein